MIALKNVMYSITLFMVYLFINSVSIILYPFTALTVKKGVRVLCYHKIYDLPRTKTYMKSLNVSPAMFSRQMEHLFHKGYHVITLKDFADIRKKNREIPKNTLVISFDDGYSDNYLNAFPIMKRYNYPPTVFLVTDYIGDTKLFPFVALDDKLTADSSRNFQYWRPLTKEEILEMQEAGAEFGSHTRTHANLTALPVEAVSDELVKSKQYLEEFLGQPVVSFCYPYGAVSRAVRQRVAEAGYLCATGLSDELNTGETDLFDLHRTSVNGDESFFTFKRRISGAYDWVNRFWRIVAAVRNLVTGKSTG
ncbi:MAG: polysaccharide deacetylase family protein [Dehalococcoidales bacterium]|nr:polysaccharide deacetylase family protein [Dehalococcoidales bacterium]